MDAKKEALVERFREYLDTLSVTYLQKANGHFHILVDGELKYQAWATTLKMVEQGGPQVVGRGAIESILDQYKL